MTEPFAKSTPFSDDPREEYVLFKQKYVENLIKSLLTILFTFSDFHTYANFYTCDLLSHTLPCFPTTN